MTKRSWQAIWIHESGTDQRISGQEALLSGLEEDEHVLVSDRSITYREVRFGTFRIRGHANIFIVAMADVLDSEA